MLLCQWTHKTHSNYHLVAAELPFVPKVIDCMHQSIKTHLEREHCILLSVTHMLCVYQLCRGVSRCAKGESCSSSSLEWKSMNWMLDAIKHNTDDIFYSRKTAHRCTCIVRATQSNCCGALDLLSPGPCPPTAPSWTHLLKDLGSHRAAWVWVVSQKKIDEIKERMDEFWQIHW